VLVHISDLEVKMIEISKLAILMVSLNSDTKSSRDIFLDSITIDWNPSNSNTIQTVSL